MAQAASDLRQDVERHRDQLGRDVQDLVNGLNPKTMMRKRLPGGHRNGSGTASRGRVARVAAATAAGGAAVVGTASRTSGEGHRVSAGAVAGAAAKPALTGVMQARRSKKAGVSVKPSHIAGYIAVAALITWLTRALNDEVDRRFGR